MFTQIVFLKQLLNQKAFWSESISRFINRFHSAFDDNINVNKDGYEHIIKIKNKETQECLLGKLKEMVFFFFVNGSVEKSELRNVFKVITYLNNFWSLENFTTEDDCQEHFFSLYKSINDLDIDKYHYAHIFKMRLSMELNIALVVSNDL